ncbi:hypothetical protein JHN53_17225 [Streptomyces sp. MBT58]|uniref:hypothetical protein n=1 Tax=Streptomyces sp. MBT58 TaxID=1488389 RepID=UPI0019122098|nr:hypothetical protein [Streptomyces sp. MBT58]MBK5993353.1 hypothetical protein [Streptomyces sp. MBT58]
MSRPTDRLPYTPPGDQQTAGSAPPGRPRLWPAIAAAIALGLALAFVWSNPKDAEQQREQRATERKAAAADRKSYMTSELPFRKAKAHLSANWGWEEEELVIRLDPTIAAPSNYVQISALGESDSQQALPHIPWPDAAEITLPIEDPPQAITLRVALGDEDWKKGDDAPSHLLRLSPEGKLTDVSTGKELPTRFS